MKKIIVFMMAVVVLLGSFACASAPQSKPETVSSAPVPQPTAVPAPSVPGYDKSGAVSPGESAEGAPANQTDASIPERMIVRTGNLSLIVDDVNSTIQEIGRFAEELGGYVVSSNSWKEGERLVGTITVRVPAGRFNNAMSTFRKLAVDITSESTSSKDVTEEYVDLESKLTNLEAAEAQLLRLMEKAEKVEDILAIQKELTRTRGEIEQTRGRMQYLERTSETSLIEVQLQQSSLEIRFTASSTRIEKGQQVWFNPQVAGGFTPYSYEWDFGDGSTSTDASPSHVFRSSGDYTVTLKVVDDRGNTKELERADYVTVLPGWNPGNTASSAWNGLVTLGHVLANIFIWVGIFSPVWIIAGLITLWARRRRVMKTREREGQ